MRNLRGICIACRGQCETVTRRRRSHDACPQLAKYACTHTHISRLCELNTRLSRTHKLQIAHVKVITYVRTFVCMHARTHTYTLFLIIIMHMQTPYLSASPRRENSQCSAFGFRTSFTDSLTQTAPHQAPPPASRQMERL